MLDAATIARVPARETGFFDALYLDFLAGDPFVSSRFPAPYRKDEAWSERARARLSASASGDAALWREAAEAHARWGASEAARRNLDDLAAGRAVAVVTGQQPDALGGPAFTLHKVLTAVALARRLESRTGIRAVPVFWCATEDSDFEEVRTVRFTGAQLDLQEAALPEEARVPGGLVGAIPIAALEDSWARARAAWKDLPGARLAGEWIERAAGRARDLGEAQAVLVLAATAAHGVVVVDPRWESFRRAALPLYERYFDRHAAVRETVERAGEELVARGYERAIQEPQSAFALFEAKDGARVKLDPESARQALARRAALVPNVVLRPIVQDAVLPAVGLIAGPGEIAYLAQLGRAYAALDVPMSLAFPRLSATWLPGAALALVRDYDVTAWDLVRDTDLAIRSVVNRLVPAFVRDELERLRREANEGLTRFAEPARAVDASLPQLVESVRAKVDFQYGRLLEALVTKRKAAFDRAHPAAARLRHALLPQGRPQERRLGWLDLVAHEGAEAVASAHDAAALHVEQAFAGEVAHYLAHPGPGRAA